MPTVYFHIGLPKTATTSLQLGIFPLLDLANIHYLGVCQPRSTASSEQFYQLVKTVCKGKDLLSTKKMISEYLAKEKSVLISEEMFTVSQKKCSWKEKLQNCAKLIEGFDYKILVTIRDPIDAMFSYYIERATVEHFLRGKSFVDIAKFDEAMKIYHSQYFFNWLYSVFEPNRIETACFERLVRGDFSELISFFDGIDQPFKACNFKKTNIKRTDGDLVFTGKKETLLMKVEYKLDIAGSGVKQKIWKSSFFRPLRKRLKK